MMRTLTLSRPPVVRFGCGCSADVAGYLAERRYRSVSVLCSSSLKPAAERLVKDAHDAGIVAELVILATGEPSVSQFEETSSVVQKRNVDCVVGMGGGSVLDVAKLIAAFAKSTKRVSECFGNDLLTERTTGLICLPTTAGTGSEVSPNAILLDESENLKKGVISPFLIPDATFIDPELAVTVPAKVTAFTGLDTLTHCIEAYTNKFAHPLVDIYALEGIRLTAKYLVRAVRDAHDLEAREAMASASYLGGLCLGPVNTAAVHALAYPLGSRYRMAHGLSNAILLPVVCRVNLPSATERYAEVARALGARECGNQQEMAEVGVRIMEELLQSCEIDTNLAAYGVLTEDIPELAVSASTVVRLLKNNPVELSLADIEQVYRTCLCTKAP